jgi:DNA-directed RNA polymerase specialized sigma24 family protein
MKNYTKSDYAINKFSKGIVYRFADCTVEVTFADYLAENPDKTLADFIELKELSDKLYLEQARVENRQTKANVAYTEAVELTYTGSLSPEALLIDGAETSERYSNRIKLALSTLTEVQRRRYMLHVVKGLSLRQIADLEGVNHSKIQNSFDAAEKKIKKVLANS